MSEYPVIAVPGGRRDSGDHRSVPFRGSTPAEFATKPRSDAGARLGSQRSAHQRPVAGGAQ